MGKSLIIVESPAKVKTIKKFLGPGYLVQASVGHIRDLPKSNIGVDEANDFAPEYEIIQGKEKVVQSLRDAASKVDTVFLAPDFFFNDAATTEIYTLSLHDALPI